VFLKFGAAYQAARGNPLAKEGVKDSMAIFQATDVVEMALELEKSGEIFYRAVAEKVPPQVRTVFEDLAEAEQNHYLAFQKLSKTTSGEPLMTEDAWDQYMMYLQATIQSTFFEGADKALALADQVTDAQEAIRMAVGFEKETMLFFHDLRDMVAEANKGTVERIITEEKSHLTLLASML
jgi:rubrerythrin